MANNSYLSISSLTGNTDVTAYVPSLDATATLSDLFGIEDVVGPPAYAGPGPFSPIDFNVLASEAITPLLQDAASGSSIPGVTLYELGGGVGQFTQETQIILTNVTVAYAQLAGNQYAFSLDYSNITTDTVDALQNGLPGPTTTTTVAVAPGGTFLQDTPNTDSGAGALTVEVSVPGIAGTSQVPGYLNDFQGGA